MQFIARGPNIPEELLQAHEDGQVVFFCGAGISYPAELPGFGGLVERIYQEVGEVASSVEQAALNIHSFDTAIGLLENRVVGHRQRVRKAIARILTPNLAKKNALATHEALLTLSKTGDSRVRLITTNFDRLFVEAMQRQKVDYPSYCAPLLPVPKRQKWDGLVYLHGLLTEHPSASDLERLVVSSGDFGLAYLTERWASRFVSELFRGYTVCFVGYSIDDPVLRYMMDALAADRLLGEKSPDAYAFGGHSIGKEEQAADEWSAKNVRPILYNNSNDHSLLHRTLRKWAESYRDGVRGKEVIVSRHGRSRPQGSTRQDNFVGRMLWALSDKTGLPAKAFADLSPPAQFEWLEEFERTSFTHRDLIRFQVAPTAEEDKKLSFSLIERPSPYNRAPWMRLVHRRGFWDSSDDIMRNIARWFAKHLNDPRSLLWVSKQGGAISDHLRYLIGDALEQGLVTSPSMQAYWKLVLAGRLYQPSVDSDIYGWSQELKREGRLTTLLRLRLKEHLNPVLKISEGYALSDEDDGVQANGSIEWEITFPGPHTAFALRDLFANDILKAALPSLLGDATDLLAEAMDIAAIVEGGKGTVDRTYYQRPSIAAHTQNRALRDWTALIDLVRDAWLANVADFPARALREFDRWGEFEHVVFRRLQLFALATHLELFGAQRALDALFADGSKWLWSVEVQREVLRLVAVIAPLLDQEQAEHFIASVLNRPQQPWDHIDEDRRARRNDRETWRILALYEQSGGPINPDAQERLEAIRQRYPQWGEVRERDEFPVYMESGGFEQAFEAAPISRRELKEWIKIHREATDFHDSDDFLERCRRDFPRTSLALLDLARDGDWVVARWRQALQAWSNDNLAARSWRCIGPRIVDAPDSFFSEVYRAVTNWLQACGKFASVNRSAFVQLAERLLTQEVEGQDAPGSSALSDALNNPIGELTEGIIKLWYSQDLDDGQGLADDIEPLMTALCNVAIIPFANGRLFLCSNAISLFRVDEAWTKENLLPLFDWKLSKNEARIAWSGFLWSPRLYWPLMRRLKTEFLQTASHYDELGELADQYAGLLTFAALDSVEGFLKSEFAAATANLPEAGLAQALQTVTDGLDSSGGKIDEYWENRAKPYFRYVWPKSQDRLTVRISAAFARLIVSTGDKFPEALETLKDWLQRTEQADYALHLLDENDLVERYPAEALKFLDLVVSREVPWSLVTVDKCLKKILAAMPSLTDDARMVDLQNLLKRRGRL
ncbi:anti-phage defense-associated sirtuin Dsr1 [Rhizobium ruizarguesonis]